jgi:hypothetical protein
MKALRAAPAAMGRGTARPGNTTAEPPKTPATRGNAGSTIMAVLIALVFIGIVTAAMVRNTGSQSSASVGYGTMQTMAVTTSSGMIATESSFENKDKEMINVLNKFVKNNATAADSFVYGGYNKKTSIADGQFFSSRIVKYNYSDKDNQRAEFEIKSGTADGKKSLKTARAFYHVGNVKIDGETIFGGSNSLVATGNGKIETGNGGFNAYGHVTLETGLTTQGQGKVQFLPQDGIGGSVYVKGTTKFVDNPSVIFDVNAFFDGYVDIGNIGGNGNVFKKDVGFNGNVVIKKPSGISVDGNVWMNGDFRASDGNKNTDKMSGNEIKYTEKLSLIDLSKPGTGCCAVYDFSRSEYTRPTAPSCYAGGATYEIIAQQSKVNYSATSKKCVWQATIFGNCLNWLCATHGNGNTTMFDHQHIDANYISGFNTSQEYPPPEGSFEGNANKESLLQESYRKDISENKLQMSPIQTRLNEPEISMTQLPAGKVYIDISQSNAPNATIKGPNGETILDARNLKGNTLQNFYNATKDHPDYQQYYKDGQLLIKIPQNFSVNTAGGEFDGKVIYNIEGQLTGNNFYSTPSTNASTLIYVGATGTINDFGVQAGNTFRGLIYIDDQPLKPDPYNPFKAPEPPQHEIKWGDGSKIYGAVMIRGGKVYWNDSGKGVAEIYRDNEVLKNFSFLVKKKPGDPVDEDNKKATLQNDSKGVELTPAGYYFY